MMRAPCTPLRLALAGTLSEVVSRALAAGMYRSQNDLAAAVGVSSGTLSGYLSGRKSPNVDMIYVLAHRLDVGVCDLLPDPAENDLSERVERWAKQNLKG